MRILNLRQKQSCGSTISNVYQRPQFCASLFYPVMATRDNLPLEPKKEPIGEKEEEAEREEEKKKLPPPPDKPEPGDCCGSGCVRCVWDVYYDELEAYNKLCKTDPQSQQS